MEIWLQRYDPLHNQFFSTFFAALPVVVLLASIALLRIRIHFSALLGLGVALAITLAIYRMPLRAAMASVFFGAAYGLFPIGWIILNLIFLYQLTVKAGLFEILRDSLSRLAPDPRVQVILIAFSFGAFFEGAAGFGTPVAVTAAILIQLGFKPLAASGLSLIANTAPVAFGALGTPILALSKVTGLSEIALSSMVGRQLPFFSLLIPFWVVWAMAGFRGMCGVWPAALTAGLAFAVPQFLVSNLHGPWLVDIVSSISSMTATAVLLRFWQPREKWKLSEAADPPGRPATERKKLAAAWTPWILLSLLLFFWGLPLFKHAADRFSAPAVPIPGLHQVVQRAPPIALENAAPEPAVFTWNWISATGTAVLVAAVLAGIIMGFCFSDLCFEYCRALVRVRYSLLTIAAMLALGYVTRYSGIDATLGLALAQTGTFYPFFGTLLGWLGVALTGSDTASNFLFGSLQTIAAKRAGLSPVLMAAANSSGGVMGKMIDAQSIVVASTVTNWYGHEGSILRYVFFHSLALAILMGILVMLQAYVIPFSRLVVP